MGAWGTGLWEDDLSCDIQDEWNELMDEGVSPRKATKIILKSWQEELSDYDDEEDKQADESILFISLAGLQMRHKALTAPVKKKALQLIGKGADLAPWEDAADESYQERKSVLEKFGDKLKNTKSSLF
ncbi:MarR family transcriptional regulator [Neobacillus sp. PS2-9]|uniref:MarR family transcriptional regulator n=1 Tax=Neobacillus sp. PS2-9 TaxID=3070676 RepID=UPI0027DEDE21|nr:MarR family transcriptional regulator [Neobacillus sp. PS2-9]WML58681.1 MarR family transcriptional regulator [Neobacillus sp. PS2-9]